MCQGTGVWLDVEGDDLLYFTTSEGIYSVRLGKLSYGGWGFVSPSNFLILLWLDRPCLLIMGLYAFHPALVFFKTLSF